MISTGFSFDAPTKNSYIPLINIADIALLDKIAVGIVAVLICAIAYALVCSIVCVFSIYAVCGPSEHVAHSVIGVRLRNIVTAGKLSELTQRVIDIA